MTFPVKIRGRLLTNVIAEGYSEDIPPYTSIGDVMANKYNATWNAYAFTFDFHTEDDMLVFLMRFA